MFRSAGPTCFPIIGCSYIVKKYSIKYGGFSKALTELCKVYKTDILGLRLGGSYTVVFQADNHIKEVFLKDEFLGRPKNFFIYLRSMCTNKGITMTDGFLWHEQRTFAMKHLQNLGFGKEIMEKLMQEEIQKFINSVQKDGLKLGIKLAVSRCVLNVLWTLVAGFKINTEEIDELLTLMHKRTKAFDLAGGTISQFSWIRFIAPESSGYNLINQLNYKLKNIISRAIEEHKATYSKHTTRDYIDAFLHEMYGAQDKHTTFTDDQLIMGCLDFFIAGSETTSTSIIFLLLHMIRSPDIQEKVYEEISSILKPGQISSLSHRDQMPYVKAVMLENERMTPVAPIAGPRRVLKDISIGGYTLKKNTTVLLNIMASANDENKWKDPAVFSPSRFLKNNFQVEKEKLLTFGRGKRRCPGEKLAKGFIFLFFSSLLNNFKIKNSDDNSIPSLQCLPGIVPTPLPFELTFTPRRTSVTEFNPIILKNGDAINKNGEIKRVLALP
ncbi:probable cytochrome P450 305a1 isoform X2 [Rhodnius prolixus]|uniref:probable cytochrome P450 305a1 isoform X2 n=1 Tax=Rhodnius prolixus TaxID=13249 RepID=UPI003D18CA77